MRKPFSFVILVVLAMFLLAACGGGGGGQATQQGDDGDTVRVEFETDEGTTVETDIQTGSGVPADFPLPVYDDWTVLTAAKAEVEGVGVRWQGSFQFEGPVDTLVAEYAAELESLGYAIDIMQVGESNYGIVLTGTYEGRPVDGRVSIGVAGEMNVINISFGDPID